MEIINNILNSFWFETILKLLLGTILCAIIGLERSSWNKPAGFRTHSLVGVCAVLIMLCGEYMSTKYAIDPSRLAAQLLSGIGFIGAGTILREGFNVKGLTTAASLLAVTCIGLSIGAGFYVGGIVATIIVYLILSYSYLFSEKLYQKNVFIIEIKTNDDVKKLIEKIKKLSETYNIVIKQIKQIKSREDKNKNKDEEKEEKENKEITIKFVGQYRRTLKKNELITEIASLENVNEVIEDEEYS